MNLNLNELRRNVEKGIQAYNEALVKSDLALMNHAENEIKEAEKEFAQSMQILVFTACRNESNPVLEAVKRRSFYVVGHRAIREDGEIVCYEMVEDRERQIDLVKLCKYCSLPTTWAYKVEKLGNLLCMRTAKELGIPAAEIKKLDKLYYMSALARKEDMGAVPTSNNQIVKLIQQIFDAILYVEGETAGKNIYRVVSRDVEYLMKAYTRRSNKKKLVIDVAKTSFVHSLLMDIMHRIVTGGVYGVGFQMVKPKDEDAEKPAKSDSADSETVIIPRSVGVVETPETDAPSSEALGGFDPDELELPPLDELCLEDIEAANA